MQTRIFDLLLGIAVSTYLQLDVTVLGLEIHWSVIALIVSESFRIVKWCTKFLWKKFLTALANEIIKQLISNQ